MSSPEDPETKKKVPPKKKDGKKGGQDETVIKEGNVINNITSECGMKKENVKKSNRNAGRRKPKKVNVQGLTPYECNFSAESPSSVASKKSGNQYRYFVYPYFVTSLTSELNTLVNGDIMKTHENLIANNVLSMEKNYIHLPSLQQHIFSTNVFALLGVVEWLKRERLNLSLYRMKKRLDEEAKRRIEIYNSDETLVNLKESHDTNLGKKKLGGVHNNRVTEENVVNITGSEISDSSGTTTVKKMKQQSLEKKEFDGKEKVFVNSSTNTTVQNSSQSPKAETSKNEIGGNENEKREKKKKKLDSKNYQFPKHLNELELNVISRFGILLSGVIRINHKNFKKAYVPAPDKGADILIEGLMDRNRALEGDEVYYVMKGTDSFVVNENSGEVHRTAVVVALKNKHHDRTAVGVLKPPEKIAARYTWFCPRDFRVPKIRIHESNWPPGFSQKPELFKYTLYHAKISSWFDCRFAEGKLTKQLGDVGDIESETSAIMLMCQLDESPYPEELKCYLPPLPFVISKREIACRLDLRKECIFTIDPPTAKDLDDAVSCKRLENGNYQIGVHISDVTHFLHDGSPLDAAVAKRATSVYLVQKVFHMLPRELCELCSLTAGEDKLAFSVIWEITPNFDIVNFFFTRSVLNSCGQFSYDQVQDILDGVENVKLPKLYGNHTLENIRDAVQVMNKIAIHLRKKRFDNGALRIDQTKISFNLDQFGLPVSYDVYVHKEAHRLIEEFMLLANITVAERIVYYFPDIAFLRSHMPPAPYLLNKIKKFLDKNGINIDISTSESINSSLVSLRGTDRDSEAKLVALYALLAKPMARATYYCASTAPDKENKRHYALNVPLYTHFTSPIRRYADIVVHRLLAASLGYRQIRGFLWSPYTISRIAANCNKQKYAAKLAGEKSTELFLSLYISLKGSLICNAVVTDTKEKCFDCIVLENGSHQRVYLPGEIKVQKTEDGVLQVNWPKEGIKEETVQTIAVFSIVKVELKCNAEPNKIKAKLVREE